MSKAFIQKSEREKENPVDRARGASMQVLIGPDAGAPNFITRKFTLEPGGRIPAHRHPDIEHEQYVLRGRMHIGVDGEEHQVEAGQAIFLPAGSTHWYENRGDEPVEFLCIVPKTKEYATEWLE